MPTAAPICDYEKRSSLVLLSLKGFTFLTCIVLQIKIANSYFFLKKKEPAL